MATGFAFALAINPILRLAGWGALPRPRTHAVVSVVVIVVSLLVAWTARRGLLSPVRLLDLGLAYEVVGRHGHREGATPMELVLHHVQTAPVPPSQRGGAAVPRALEDLILTCLEKDPARRPASAAELGRRLEATGLPQRWTPEQSRKWWEAHVPPAAATAR